MARHAMSARLFLKALNARAATAATDPCSAVIPKIPVEGVAAAFAALEAGGEAFHSHPAYLRAFARVAEAAITQGAAGSLPAWADTALGAFKAATAVAAAVYPVGISKHCPPCHRVL
jgi:hypothetical protein